MSNDKKFPTLERYRAARRWGWNLWFAAGIAVAALLESGCAILPMSMQPKDPDARHAEAVWDVLDTVDTYTTQHFLKKPTWTVTGPTGTTTFQCQEADPLAKVIYGGAHPAPARVIGTNLLLMGAHSYVSRWFDDEYDKSVAADDGDVGVWWTGRFLWHALSIGGSAWAVTNNLSGPCH